MSGRRVAVALVLLALVVAGRGLERHTTWYLASDQFAFLTQADDLQHGRVSLPSRATCRPVRRPTPLPDLPVA